MFRRHKKRGDLIVHVPVVVPKKLSRKAKKMCIRDRVYTGLFPIDADQYPALRDALDKLTLNDPALVYEPETSQALGFGFRVGFLGLLQDVYKRQYLERVTVDTPAHVRKAKKAIKKAFQNQVDGVGYSLVEVVSTCPTNWGMTPQESFEWMRENMLPYYPLGVYRDVLAEGYESVAAAALDRAKDSKIVAEGGAR